LSLIEFQKKQTIGNYSAFIGVLLLPSKAVGRLIYGYWPTYLNGLVHVWVALLEIKIVIFLLRRGPFAAHIRRYGQKKTKY